MTKQIQLWFGTFPVPGRSAKIARLLESEGWDGLALTDSQNISGDVFVGLAMAAQATTQLGLATGATNLGTRHPAVVASAISSIQAESHGRAILGLARGDSALAYIGRPPQPLAEFVQNLGRLQSYLRGETVDLDGFASHMNWHTETGLPKVAVSIAATGPRVIEVAARLAERITFSVGADIERLTWAVEHARTARRQAGLDPTTLSLGAYVNAVAHPDAARARELVRGRLGVYARFASMHQNAMNGLRQDDREAVTRLVSKYEMSAHGMGSAGHATEMDDAFVDRFGIAGPSDYVAERLRGVMALGLDHLVIVGHGRDADFATLADSIHRFGREVIPQLR